MPRTQHPFVDLLAGLLLPTSVGGRAAALRGGRSRASRHEQVPLAHDNCAIQNNPFICYLFKKSYYVLVLVPSTVYASYL